MPAAAEPPSVTVLDAFVFLDELALLAVLAISGASIDAPMWVRIALAVATVSLASSNGRLRRAARHLDRELDRQILGDGGHISRNSRTGLELLFELLPLRQTYVNLGHDIPARLMPAITPRASRAWP